MVDEVPTGTIMPFNGEFLDETKNWIICDGIKRENNDDKYRDLIKLSIGTITDDNFYIPPNYDNMSLTESADVIKYDGKSHIHYDGHLHYFSNNPDNSVYYNTLPKPLLLMSDSYSKWLIKCYKMHNVYKIKWIIKY